MHALRRVAGLRHWIDQVAQDRDKRLPALWESKDRAAEARATAEVMAANDIAAFQTEWQLVAE